MNTREIKKEANLLYKAVLPLLEMRGNFEQIILTDLAKIVQICGRSNNEITSNELLAFLVVYALIKQDAEKLNAAINSWDTSSEVRRASEKETLKILLELANHESQDSPLALPSVLNKLDEEKGGNYLNKTVNAVYRFAQVIAKADGRVTMQEMESLSKIWQMLHSYESPANYVPGTTAETISLPGQNLDKVLDELNQLIGMENIKSEIRTLTNFLKVQQVRSQRGLAKTSVSLHSVFSGPPGTGKTTVARLVGKIFKELGFLNKGELIETDRAGMVASHIGGTSEKVNTLVNSALDGVLFIDEAYALNVESGQDFGKEAIDVLLKRMEDYRSRLVVIVAGYTDLMASFVESNPGLKSRFNRYFYFNDYTPEELLAIFNKFCKDSHFKTTDAANQTLLTLLTNLYNNRDETFGNARLVRNLFEKTIERQANRLAVITALTDEVLTTIQAEDIPSVEAISPRQDLIAADERFENVVDLEQERARLTPQMGMNQLVKLMNQALQPKGITAKGHLRDSCLQMMFEANLVPDQQQMITLTGKALKRVKPEMVTSLKLYGRQQGEEFPAWSQEFEIREDVEVEG